LQTLAFGILANHDQPWQLESRLEAVKILAQASGASGMAGGQMLDIEAENNQISLPQLETLHSLKTGALIRASIQLGAIAAGCQNKQWLQDLDEFAQLIGLAFQVQDDLLDVESSTEVLGKRAGADQALNKMTYPSLLGVETAKKRLLALYEQASSVLIRLPWPTQPLYDVWSLLKNRQS
jgi:farnesyl diphosphate synthase